MQCIRDECTFVRLSFFKVKANAITPIKIQGLIFTWDRENYVKTFLFMRCRPLNNSVFSCTGNDEIVI